MQSPRWTFLEGRKRFFFEKKKQKTFANGGVGISVVKLAQ
jgi:hypothetical protein